MDNALGYLARVAVVAAVPGLLGVGYAGADGWSESVAAQAAPAAACTPPGILVNPRTEGDIPVFVDRLQQAYCAADAEMCAALPEPMPQTFFYGDYAMRAPSRAAWMAYCGALAARDPYRCQAVDQFVDPNLQHECVSFFQRRAEANNTSPAFCLEEVGGAYSSDGDVRNCLIGWSGRVYGNLSAEGYFAADPVPPLTRFDLDLLGCLTYPRPSALTEGQPNQHQCLYALAQRTGSEKVCQIISNPYANQLGSNVWSRPNCLEALRRVAPR